MQRRKSRGRKRRKKGRKRKGEKSWHFGSNLVFLKIPLTDLDPLFHVQVFLLSFCNEKEEVAEVFSEAKKAIFWIENNADEKVRFFIGKKCFGFFG